MSDIRYLKFKMEDIHHCKTDKKYYIFLIINTLLIFSINIYGQNTLTLSDAILKGLENGKNIKAGKLDASISKLQTQALYRKYWPKISADYTYLYNPILPTSILPIGVFNPTYPIDATKGVQFGTKWTQSAGITVIQPLLDFSIRKQINEATLQEALANTSQDQVTYDLAYIIAQKYIDIFLDEAKIQSLIADTNRTYISYMLLKNKYEEKRLLKSDLNNAIINHNNTVQLWSDGIHLLIKHKVYLLYLMGSNEKENWNFSVDTTFTNKYPLGTMNDSIRDIDLPELQYLDLQNRLTQLQVSSENVKHLPTIDFKGFLGANQYENSFHPVAPNSWFGLSYLGVEIKLPILFGESTQNKIQQLKLQSEQYRFQKEDKVLQNSNDMILARLNMAIMKTQLKTQVQNILLSLESIDIFQARVKEGQESAANLNTEEAKLQVMKATMAWTEKQSYMYWLDHLKASGQLITLWK